MEQQGQSAGARDSSSSSEDGGGAVLHMQALQLSRVHLKRLSAVPPEVQSIYYGTCRRELLRPEYASNLWLLYDEATLAVLATALVMPVEGWPTHWEIQALELYYHHAHILQRLLAHFVGPVKLGQRIDRLYVWSSYLLFYPELEHCATQLLQSLGFLIVPFRPGLRVHCYSWTRPGTLGWQGSSPANALSTALQMRLPEVLLHDEELQRAWRAAEAYYLVGGSTVDPDPSFCEDHDWKMLLQLHPSYAEALDVEYVPDTIWAAAGEVAKHKIQQVAAETGLEQRDWRAWLFSKLQADTPGLWLTGTATQFSGCLATLLTLQSPAIYHVADVSSKAAALRSYSTESTVIFPPYICPISTEPLQYKQGLTQALLQACKLAKAVIVVSYFHPSPELAPHFEVVKDL